MRSFILGTVVCLGTLFAGASSASAQVVTYSTPYGGLSYGVAYPGYYGYSSYYQPYVASTPYVAGYTPYSYGTAYYPTYPGYYNGWTTGYRYSYAPYGYSRWWW